MEIHLILKTSKETFIALCSSESPKLCDVVVILEGDGTNRVRKGCELFHNKFAPNIIFSGGIDYPQNGSFPFKAVSKVFVSFGIDPKRVLVENDSLHTRGQAENVITLCMENGWKRILLVATHYHQFRAFLTFLKVLTERHIEREIYIVNTPAIDPLWFSDDGWGCRVDLLQLEFQKIADYQKKGHVSTFDEAIEYFRWKESI